MRLFFLSMIVIVLAPVPVPSFVKAQKPTPEKGALPKRNQVYVKIIMSTDPASRAKDQPVVESWIAENIKKHGESKFTAATAWVMLVEKGDKFEDPTLIWEGGCRVHGQILERKDGIIKVFLDGWGPTPAGVTVSLPDEPGNREIAAAKEVAGQPYVAVLIGPPSEKTAAPTDLNR